MRFIGKNKQQEQPEMSTAALPDIVFMLLFFFMVTTVMREENPKMELNKPRAQMTQKIEDKSLVASIFVGSPNKSSKEVKIQIDERFVELHEIGQIITEKRALLPEALQPKFITVLKADKDVEMGVITKVKQELRKAQALKIQYSTLAENEFIAKK